MKQLRWSDFSWFKKKSKVYYDDTYFTCSEKKGVDQKIIFPLKERGKHLTLSLSDRYLDLHATDNDRTVLQRSIMEIRLKKTIRMIKKSCRPRDVIFVPFHDKMLKRLILVDPYSREFITSAQKMDQHNVMPQVLAKIQIRSMRNNHGKILTAFDVFGQFKGILKCDHQRGGFNFVPANSISRFERKLIDPLYIKNKLREEGLKENPRYKIFWYKWYKMIKLVEYIQRKISQIVYFIISSNKRIQ